MERGSRRLPGPSGLRGLVLVGGHVRDKWGAGLSTALRSLPSWSRWQRRALRGRLCQECAQALKSWDG